MCVHAMVPAICGTTSVLPFSLGGLHCSECDINYLAAVMSRDAYCNGCCMCPEGVSEILFCPGGACILQMHTQCTVHL